MKVVWRNHPVSVRDVLESVEGKTGWAYSTVKTILSRLVDKGALELHRRANASLFTPAVGELEARRSALRSLLEQAFDGRFDSFVHHLVADERLSESERDELRALLEREHGEGDS
jgi:predicted transcriptional regulator